MANAPVCVETPQRAADARYRAVPSGVILLSRRPFSMVENPARRCRGCQQAESRAEPGAGRAQAGELYLRIGLTWLAMVGLAVAALGLTWLVAGRMAARLARPLEDLSRAARRLGEGDFTVRASPAGVAEIDSVSSSLNTTAQRFGDMLEHERAFSANASHQLRTPLAGLRLQLEAALDTQDIGDSHAALRDGIDTADRLERTIHDLLTLARNRRPAAEIADLAALLAEVEQGWRGMLAARGRQLHVVADDPPAPRASEQAIRQILAVLLDNAVTHGQGTVTVTARDAGDALAMDVSDGGPGIADDVDPFARRDLEPGRGIGLALARGLAEAEGGRLWLSCPAPPAFTLLLPIDEPSLAAG